jgi:hypothetical protein
MLGRWRLEPRVSAKARLAMHPLTFAYGDRILVQREEGDLGKREGACRWVVLARQGYLVFLFNEQFTATKHQLNR